MGDVKKYLSKTKLPERQKHNSRLFVDLAENIHIHHREYRTVFSIDEFLEYTDVILKSREELLSYLENNPDYEEMKFPTTIWVSGGRSQQLKYLQNSPFPNESCYFNDELTIELQEEYVADEIHIHYRDFRIACNRQTFKEITKSFHVANKALEEFENQNDYQKKSHPDSDVINFNQNLNDFMNSVQGTKEVEIKQIESFWYQDITKEMNPNMQYINNIIKAYEHNYFVTPIVISVEDDGRHFVIDGHHRLYAAIKLGKNTINSVIVDINFIDTQKIRDAEVCLKEFDKQTNWEYELSDFFKSYISMKMNRFYYKNFSKITKKLSLYQKIKRNLIKLILGKEKLFFSFVERSNMNNKN